MKGFVFQTMGSVGEEYGPNLSRVSGFVIHNFEQESLKACNDGFSF